MAEDLENLTFEQALAELEQLVGKMENGGMPLAQLMSGYERGRKLTEFCRKQLGEFERKISLLTADDGKNGQWTEFVPENNR